MRILITGGAGFIGSNLVGILTNSEKLNGNLIEKIVVIDNLSLGKRAFIQKFIDNGSVDFYEQDLLDLPAILKIFQQYQFDLVFHLSANSDISFSAKHTDWDLKQETLVTYNVLECMRLTGCKQVIFASTSAVYGEAKILPIPEDYGPLFPISYYGAAKLSCEGLLSAFSHNEDFQVFIYRFANIVGRNGTHGVIMDFIKKLKTDPTKLEVLGDGQQAKPYLHVDDCISGILFGYKNSKDQFNFYNLACDGATSVKQIADFVIKELGLNNVEIVYTGGSRGWKGDVTQVRLDPNKLSKLGWSASDSSDQAVKKAIAELVADWK